MSLNPEAGDSARTQDTSNDEFQVISKSLVSRTLAEAHTKMRTTNILLEPFSFMMPLESLGRLHQQLHINPHTHLFKALS
jgi:hypothetical protein